MIGLAVLFLLPFAVMALAPESRLAKALHEVLVVAPARQLNRGPLKLLVSAVVFFIVMAIAVGAPELFVLMGAAEVSLYLEGLLISAAAGAVTALVVGGAAAASTLRRAGGGLRSAVLRLSHRAARARRQRRPDRPRSGADPDPANGWAFA